MKNKINILIDSFSRREKTKAIKFLSSPYINKKKSILELFQAHDRVLSSSNASMSREAFNVSLMPKNQLSDQEWRLLNSELFKLLEKFIAFETIQKKPGLMENQIAYYYQHKSAGKLINGHLSSWVKKLLAQPYRDEEFEEQRFLIEIHKYEHHITKGRATDLHLQEIQFSLDRSFYAKKLKQACFALSHQAIYNVAYDLGLMDEICDHILKNEWQEIPAIGIYYYCYSMLKESENESHFTAFKDKLYQWASLFPIEELRSLYLLAINYCIKQLNNGDLNYGTMGMDLYDEAIKHKALLINNNLSRFTYRNMCRMAIRTGDFDRAQKLSQEYKPFLSKEYHESSFQFNLAMIFYEQGELGKALESMQKVDFKDPLFNLAAKTIQLKIYYELNEEDLLDFHLDAMKMYLIRKKVLGYHKENYRNIIRYTRHLLYMYKYNKEKREQLKLKIKQETHLTEKEWLLNQIA